MQDPAQPALSPARRRTRRQIDRRQTLGFAIAAGFGLALLIFLLRQPPNEPPPSAAPASVQSPTATPAPPPTRTVTATPTPTPPPTPEPTADPEPTPTPAPVTPAPTLTPTPLDIPPGHAAVDADVGLNVRAEPGFGGQVLRVLPDRAIVELTGLSRDDDSGTWHELAEEGAGWVLGTYLVFPEAQAPEADAG